MTSMNCEASNQRWSLVPRFLITCLLFIHASVSASTSFKVASPTDLMFITEDLASGGPGCDAISAFDLGALSDDPDSYTLHRGPTHQSPGRLAATSDFSLAIATSTNSYGSSKGFLTFLRMEPTAPPYTKWTNEYIIDDRIAMVGGIAILPGDREFLVATAAKLMIIQDSYFRNVPPFQIKKFAIPSRGSVKLGRELGTLNLERAGAEIIISPDGRKAHILTDGARVHTIDVDTMRETVATIAISSVDGLPSPIQASALYGVRAALSLDGRYLIANQGIRPEVSIADLIGRRAWNLPTSPAKMTGGLAVNRGSFNHGLLAVHHRDQIAVYRLDPLTGLFELGTIKIPAPQMNISPVDGHGPLLSIAWGGNGAYLIAASDDRRSEFVIIEVKSGGTSLAIKQFLTVCEPALNAPNDILTWSNPNIPPPLTPTPAPTDAPTPSVTPSPTDPPSPTHTMTPSATPTPSPTPTTVPSTTPSPTPSPTVPPLVPIYLPIILTETCAPSQRRADVLLVIDTSSSMLERTSAGRPKIEAAREAAGSFIDLLQLPSDQAGITWFNETAGLAQALTGDRAALRSALQSLTVHQFTRIDLGVQIAHAELLSPRHKPGNAPVLILLTDGRSNPVPASYAVDAAARAKADGITVFTIGVGRDLDEAALAEMASPCKAGAECPYYFKAPDAEELGAIYRRIAEVIPCGLEAFWGRR